MPLSFLRNHGYLLYNYVANMLTFSYPLRTGEQGVQGELGKKRNRENSEKKGNRETGRTTTNVRTIYDETKGQ